MQGRIPVSLARLAQFWQCCCITGRFLMLPNMQSEVKPCACEAPEASLSNLHKYWVQAASYNQRRL